MAFNEKLSDRIREVLADQSDVEEKYMFGGVCYMVNGKMCVGVIKDDMMCRIGPDKEEASLEKKGCRPMDFTSRPMKGYVYVDESGWKSKKDLEYWVGLCLEFNAVAKPAKKKAAKKV